MGKVRTKQKRKIYCGFREEQNLREGGGEVKKSHAKAHGAGGGAWRGRSGCLLPHPSAQQQPWHLPASPCPQVRASAAGRGQPPRLPPRPPAACLHAAQQTPGAAGAPAPARGERTQKREPPSGLHLETRGACLGQHAGRRACLLYTSPSPRDATLSRMPSSA